MINENSIHGAISLVALIILFVMFMTVWQRFVVDVVRQRVFEIRDRNLLWAFDKGVLDSPAYVDFRHMTNVTIRYFEEMSLFKVFATHWVWGKRKLPRDSLKRCAFLDDSHLNRQFHVVSFVLLAGIVLRSPFGVIACMVLGPILLLLMVLNGGGKMRTNRIASTLSNDVQTEILHAARSSFC